MSLIEQVRLLAAVTSAKATGALSQSLGLGGGTNLPGRIARRIAPGVLRSIAQALPQGVVLVAGTNGKTTTARMLAAILRSAGRAVLHNRAGANLISGLTASAVAGSSPRGKPRAQFGLFETDEAALAAAISETSPRLVLIHNLFRDQLDRYGEVDAIAARWKQALHSLPATATVLLNADDPAVAYLGVGLTCRVVYYGVEDLAQNVGAVQQMADSQFCQRCGAAYTYSAVFYGHVGHYRCPNCGLARPQPQVRLVRLIGQATSGSRLLIAYPGGALDMQLPLPGFYNAVNALAACAAALCLEIEPRSVRGALETFSAAFGRIERIDAAGKPLLMALIKNPVGASETVRMLTAGLPAPDETQLLHLLIIINDRAADGTDVSWLWDADFERLAGAVATAVVSGTRGADMAVRLKYAGVAPERISTVEALSTALEQALAALPAGQTLYVLPTYTAMLELRAEMARRGWVGRFWQD